MEFTGHTVLAISMLVGVGIAVPTVETTFRGRVQKADEADIRRLSEREGFFTALFAACIGLILARLAVRHADALGIWITYDETPFVIDGTNKALLCVLVVGPTIVAHMIWSGIRPQPPRVTEHHRAPFVTGVIVFVPVALILLAVF